MLADSATHMLSRAVHSSARHAQKLGSPPLLASAHRLCTPCCLDHSTLCGHVHAGIQQRPAVWAAVGRALVAAAHAEAMDHRCRQNR